MNQRSVSAKRTNRQRAQTDASFEQKVSQAIHQKKTLISKMTSQKSDNHTILSHRLSPFWKGKEHNHNQQSITHQKHPKTVYLSDEMVGAYNHNHQLIEGFCVNHPSKKAAFEQKHQRDSIYCHECAIRIVKNDGKVVGITPQSIMFKSIVSAQLTKISEEEYKVREIVREYYAEVRKHFEDIYVEYLEQKTLNPENILFAQFQQSKQLFSKLTQSLGTLQQVRFRLVSEESKQNKKVNTNQMRPSNQRANQKQKDVSFDLAIQNNRYPESKSYREPNKYIRARENSEYLRKDKLEPRKTLKLR